jgi:hypothetical protein
MGSWLTIAWILWAVLIFISALSSYISRDKKNIDWWLKLLSGVVIAVLLLVINIKISNIEQGQVILNSNGDAIFLKNVERPQEEEVGE